MRRLSEPIKRRIVEHLACYRSHVEVVELVEEEFGFRLSTRHVRAYDPTCYQCVASDRLREYHSVVRERFASKVADIPIANRVFRLRELQKIYYEAVEAENLTQAAKALEQAAMEVGGMFINTRTMNMRAHRVRT